MMSDATVSSGFGAWAVLELMGHVKIAGYVTEEKLFGVELGRIDIPVDDKKSITQYFGGSSVYRITPITEDVARAFAARNQPRPIYTYELALPDNRPSEEEMFFSQLDMDDEFDSEGD